MQTGAGSQGTKLWWALCSPSVLAPWGWGNKAGHMGFLACKCKWALPEALSRGGEGMSLLSAHPVADPARLGVERGQLPGLGPRRAEVIAGRQAVELRELSRGNRVQARTGAGASSCCLPGGPCGSTPNSQPWASTSLPLFPGCWRLPPTRAFPNSLSIGCS